MTRFRNWPRGAAAALLVSLCLNGLLLGYFVTTQLERLRPAGLAAGPKRLVEVVASRLPRDDAELLWRVFRAHEPAIKASQGTYQASLGQAAGILAQPAPDVDALRRAIQEARDRRVELGDLAIGMLVEALPQMSAAGRQKLVGSLRRP